jgi:hypothetical protein
MASSTYFWIARCCFVWILLACLALIVQAQDNNEPLQPIPETRRIPGTEINQPAVPASRSSKPQPPPFIIGVWCQPTRNFPVWKARGLNALVGYESESNSVSLDQWSDAAARNGLWMIRQPKSSAREDRDTPYLLAWMQQDEPDVHSTAGNELNKLYEDLKAVESTRPIFLNISGGNLIFNKTPRSTYQKYFGAADWIGNDLYPVTGWDQPTWLPRVGEAVDMARTISGGKPQFAFIETSQQRLGWTPKNTPGVTPAQLRVEIWDAVIHGVKGIVYFSDQFNPFNYDGTPSAVSIEMTHNNELLAELAPELVNTTNAPHMTVSVNSPLEAAWRVGADGTAYVMVLNLSPNHQADASIRLSGLAAGAVRLLNQDRQSLSIGNNGFTDSFAGYDLHIYAITPPATTRHR